MTHLTTLRAAAASPVPDLPALSQAAVDTDPAAETVATVKPTSTEGGAADGVAVVMEQTE